MLIAGPPRQEGGREAAGEAAREHMQRTADIALEDDRHPAADDERQDVRPALPEAAGERQEEGRQEEVEAETARIAEHLAKAGAGDRAGRPADHATKAHADEDADITPALVALLHRRRPVGV